MNFAVKVFYHPRFVEYDDIKSFKMICDSGNQADLNFKGRSINFDIAFSTNSINFGEVKLDSYSSKILTITNAS